MLIFDENNDAIILDGLQGPIPSDYMYVLDLSIMDFTLAPLLIFEEIICPTITIMVSNFAFELPANWNVLVSDEETLQLDVVEVSELAGKEFKALVYGMDMSMPKLEKITVCDYHPNFKNTGPSLNKFQMLCHPISPKTWINVAPSDSYNKYLKNKVIGDIL